MNRLSLIIASTIILLAMTAEALAAGGAGGDHGVPWSSLIIPQIVNVSIFVTLLFVALRKPVKDFFASKEADFTSAVRKAAEIKEQAEKANLEIKTRLGQLEQNAELSRKDAIKESAELKQRLIKEALEAAQKSASEAEKSIFFEHERAVAALRSELVTNSIRVAQEQVRAGVDPGVLTSLQKGFSQKAASAHRGAQR